MPMEPIEIEYTICQIQSGEISLAAKTHRRLDGDPRLEVDLTRDLVTWRLLNLVDGTPETIVSVPRQNHVDFYFLYKDAKSILAQLPNPTTAANSSLSLPPVSSAGFERPGGKRVRIVAPVRRYQLLSVELFVTQAPSFHAIGIDPYIHMDVESTPSDLYGEETFEIHFGIQAEFEIVGAFSGNQSTAVIEMRHDTYATIHREMSFL
jgi:hypothetical protein